MYLLQFIGAFSCYELKFCHITMFLARPPLVGFTPYSHPGVNVSLSHAARTDLHATPRVRDHQQPTVLSSAASELLLLLFDVVVLLLSGKSSTKSSPILWSLLDSLHRIVVFHIFSKIRFKIYSVLFTIVSSERFAFPISLKISITSTNLFWSSMHLVL